MLICYHQILFDHSQVFYMGPQWRQSMQLTTVLTEVFLANHLAIKQPR